MKSGLEFYQQCWREEEGAMKERLDFSPLDVLSDEDFARMKELTAACLETTNPPQDLLAAIGMLVVKSAEKVIDERASRKFLRVTGLSVLEPLWRGGRV